MWDKVMIHRQWLIWKETDVICSYLPSCWRRILIDTLKENRGMLVGMSEGGPSKFKRGVCKIQVIYSAFLLGFQGISYLKLSLSYPACKTHAPCNISICDLSGCNICSTLSHKRHDPRGWGGGGGIYWTQNVCFDFLYIFCLKKILILRRIQRDIIINVRWPSCTVKLTVVRFH